MKKIFVLFFIMAIAFIFSTNFILAAETEDSPVTNTSNNTVQLTNPLTGNASSKSIPEFLGQIISYAMGIIGSLALVMFIYGGATWMLSGGNEEKVTKGKNTAMWAAFGIGLIFASYALVKFVISAISGAT